jgi:hypothetical protein
MICEKCPGDVRVTLHLKSKTRDKYVWACKSSLRHELSIRKHSIFEGMKSPMVSIVKNLCFWSSNTLQNTISHELSISANTVSSWYLNLRGFL